MDLCERCIGFLFRNLSLPAKKILMSLSDGKACNKNQIMIKSNLQITATNYAIQELTGAKFIEIRPLGNNKMIKLSTSGKRALALMEVLPK